MSVPEWAPATADETVVWQGQPRRRIVLQGLAIGLVGALVVAGGAVAAITAEVSPTLALSIGVPLAVVAMAIPTASVGLWRWSTSYLLTDEALYHRTGVLSLRVTELRLGKIQNTSYSQGVLGTVFDHGDVSVDTAGSEGSELVLRALEGPQHVHQRIAELSGGAAATDDIPGSLVQWQAVRAEVGRIRSAIEGD